MTRDDAPPEPGASAFVWVIWAALSINAAAFVLRDGPRVPLWDDYDVVPVLTGDRPPTAGWLWSPHNEHRVPLPRLVLLAAYRISGEDFRAGMFLNVALLAALSAGLIVSARLRRGGSSYADAFFPILLLHLGHHGNLLWSWQVQFVLSTTLAGAILILIASRTGPPTARGAVVAGLILALLPLCGANGLALVPALVLWLIVSALVRWRTGARRDGLLIGLSAIPAVLVSVLYVRGGAWPARAAAGPEITAALRTSLQFLAVGMGPSAEKLWPYSGIAVVALLASTAAALALAARTRPANRPEIIGLFCFLGGMLSLALGLGLGRAGAGERAGFEARYVTLAAPVLAWAQLAWGVVADRAGAGRFVPMVLLAGSCVLLWPNSEIGLDAGAERARLAREFVRDLKSGTPAYQLIRRYTPFLHPSQDVLGRSLPLLSRAGIEPFRSLRPDPPFREVSVPVVPTSVRLATWEDQTAHVRGVDPQLVFTLPGPRFVAGIRLRYRHQSAEGTPARFRLSWRSGRRDDDPLAQQYSNWSLPTGPETRTTTVWIGGPIRSFRIQPDNKPCRFHIAEITLLVPDPAATVGAGVP